jgi:hypothetical protein
MVDRDSASDYPSSCVVHAPLTVRLRMVGQVGCTPVCIGPEAKPSGHFFVRRKVSMHGSLVMPTGKGLS